MTQFPSTLAQAVGSRNRFNCSVSSTQADSSKRRNSSFFVLGWNSALLAAAPKGQGVTDCVVLAPLHTPSYCGFPSESTGWMCHTALWPTKPSFLLFWELRFSINVKHLFVWVTVCNMLGENCMKSAAEMCNLHWDLLKYDHLCYNLLILVKGFAWYRKIYNVMDYYFITWAEGKKLQIFAGVFLLHFKLFSVLETQHWGDCWRVFRHKIWYQHITCFIWISKHV